MFGIFKRKNKTKTDQEKTTNFEIELTASVLAYEIARSDGDISDSELVILLEEIKKISSKVNKSEDMILDIVKEFSKNSISFHEFIKDINKNYSKKDKFSY